MKKSCLRLAALIVAALAISAQAQSWPNKPVKIILPFPPGGSTDLLAREVALGLTTANGQQFVVENKPGAASTLGTAFVAKAPPDGYTFLFTSSHYAIVATLYKNLPYDAKKDLAPVSMVADIPVVLVANAAVPAKSVQELIALAKAKPGALNFASSGAGGVAHLSGELFKALAGVDLRHVPYKGGAPAMQDLLGGHVQLMFDAISTSLPNIRAGKLHALAWTGKTRSPILPDLPTIAESGVPGYASAAWFAMFAPAGTPKDIIQKLSAQVKAIVSNAALRERQLGLGVDLVGSTPEALEAQLSEEIVKWAKVIKDSGAQAE
ncbi:MAG: tripartite tricarboxylate transporter substrate binding protein [Betaproteobacteria bacterium]